MQKYLVHDGNRDRNTQNREKFSLITRLVPLPRVRPYAFLSLVKRELNCIALTKHPL